MSILSIEFILFVAVVLLAYYVMPKKLRWTVLLLASLAFYAFGGWAGFGYLMAVAGITYGSGRIIALAKEKTAYTKAVLALTLVLCLGAMLFLKYFDALRMALNASWAIGTQERIPAMALLMPLGLSYFTFQSVGYVIDCYRGKCKPEKNPLKYLLFVSFFPQMTQGPISSYGQLAPQLNIAKPFDPENFVSGGLLVLWGYFKKLVIADRLARIIVDVNQVGQPGWLILLSVMIYTIRLYADFSGGMDVIRGVAQMLGIDMAENFRRPFFAASVTEYWRRWHISLGQWFRSYVFFPSVTSRLGLLLSRKGQKLLGKKVGRALPGAVGTLIIFLMIGMWHTANWNAVIYGAYFGLAMGAAMLLESSFKAIKRRFHLNERSVLWRCFCVVRTWLLILVAQYFAVTMGPKQAFMLLGSTMVNWDFSRAAENLTALMPPLEWRIGGTALLLLMVVDILGERGVDCRNGLAPKSILVRWPIVLMLLVIILVFGCYGEGFDGAAFLYTQF